MKLIFRKTNYLFLEVFRQSQRLVFMSIKGYRKALSKEGKKGRLILEDFLKRVLMVPTHMCRHKIRKDRRRADNTGRARDNVVNPPPPPPTVGAG